MTGHANAFDKDVVSFGPFRLIAAERLLEQGGVPVSLGARALDILTALVDRPGEVVSKKDLLGRVWPDVTVDEGSLRFHVASLRKALGDGLAGTRYLSTLPGRGYCFVAPVSRACGAPRLHQELGISNQASSLPVSLQGVVGRSDTVRVVSTLVESKRFVTIVGPGGIGKTTVAVSAGHASQGAFEGAVYFVDLGPVSDPLLVASALASTIGLLVHSSDPVGDLVTYLRDKRVLIILDSCEHVIEKSSELAEILFRKAPQVHLLVTSREPLRVEGEFVFRLLPLEAPPEDTNLTAAEALGFPAVQLFVDRVAANGNLFQLSDADAPVVAEICRKLDGMALAIELAAGQVAAYGIQQTARLLDGQFRLLWQGRRTALPRHQTLNATLDWSYDLLTEGERAILRRLWVFAGTFTLEAAFAVAGEEDADGSPSLDGLAGLVAKSLVSADNGAVQMRYRLLDTTRAYAERKLVESGELHQVARRHAMYFSEFLQSINAESLELSKAQASRLYGDHVGNVRSALEWSFGSHGDLGIGTALAAASARLFLHFSLLTECHRWTERAITALDDTSRGTHRELELQASLGQSLMFTRGNSEKVHTALMRGLSLADQLGHLPYQLQLLGSLQIFHERIGEFEPSLTFAEHSLSIARAIGDKGGIAAAHSFLGISRHLMGDHAGAHTHFSAALMPARLSSNIHFGFDYRNRARIALARNLWLQGYPDQAVQAARQSVDEAATLEHPVTLCIALIWAVSVFIWTGDCKSAEESIERFIAHARRHSLAPYHAVGAGVKGELAVRCGDVGTGIQMLRNSLEILHNDRYELLSTAFTTAVAEGLAMLGQCEQAIDAIDETICQVERNGDLFAMPELLRIKGELLASPPYADRRVAEELLLRSLGMGHAHGALSWELRTAMSLARLWIGEGYADRARDVLTPVYDRFTEGFGTADLRAARHLLDELD